MNKKKYISIPYQVWAVIFVLVPLGMVMYYGFTDTSGAFTLHNILQIADPENFKAFVLALLFSLISTLLCLLLAYPLAMILQSISVSQTSFIVLLFILPMWMNFLLRTMAWQTLLEKNGIINLILNFFHLPNISIINTPY
ncbi:MAG: ABC transporter permease, partial [Acetivibrio sp.]